MARVGNLLRLGVTEAFKNEGISIRFAGDRIETLPGNSLHGLLFPYDDGAELITPDENYNPEICDTFLGHKVIHLALLLEDVFTAPGLTFGCNTAAHSEDDIEVLAAKCRAVASRIRPYL